MKVQDIRYKISLMKGTLNNQCIPTHRQTERLRTFQQSSSEEGKDGGVDSSKKEKKTGKKKAQKQ